MRSSAQLDGWPPRCALSSVTAAAYAARIVAAAVLTRAPGGVNTELDGSASVQCSSAEARPTCPGETRSHAGSARTGTAAAPHHRPNVADTESDQNVHQIAAAADVVSITWFQPRST